MAYINVGFTYIIDYICEGILTGRFPEGERIPSVRDMAVLMQVAPNTVVHAYEKLTARELIYTQRGIGFYISTGAKERVRSQRKALFMEETIPQVQREARLIGISADELREALEL